MKKYAISLLIFLSTFGFGQRVLAHEAYVIPYGTFWNDLDQHESFNNAAFASIKDSNNLFTALSIASAVLALLALYQLFQFSKAGERVNNFLERFSKYGTHFVRITIAASLFFSALSNSVLGPELHLSLLPHAALVKSLMFASSIMIFFGIFTELAALISIGIFLLGLKVFGAYLLTYLNYLGEFIVLTLFGLRSFSFDRFLYRPLEKFKSLKKYDTLIIRVFYGSALLYAAVNVKLLHPELTTLVVNVWHLNQFHWLFPRDPLLITLGAGVVEAIIGIFIIFGFELRLTVLISLFYITLSLFYFREMVWPHLLLYGISLNLLVAPETYTLDNYLLKKYKRSGVK